MHSRARRIEELRGFHVRVHVKGRSTTTVDGTCRGVEDGRAVLSPSSQGERTEIPLEQIAAVTQLAGEFEGGEEAQTEQRSPGRSRSKAGRPPAQDRTRRLQMEFEGYCVKCRKKQTIKEGTVKETAKGRQMAQGTCPECGTKVNRFLPSKKEG